ncbi:MAG: cupin domain-containing protein [Corynebacterium sp.]|nr:cupin domain-containing protein [Corynebacterium sp.]
MSHEFNPIFPQGEYNEDFQQYFIGKSYFAPLLSADVNIGNVTFEPGCRNNWHTHYADGDFGQILLCISGAGWYQEEGKEAQALKPGDVVHIKPGVKHWHGAQKDSWFNHVVIMSNKGDLHNEWHEPVDDDYYNAL